MLMRSVNDTFFISMGAFRGKLIFVLNVWKQKIKDELWMIGLQVLHNRMTFFPQCCLLFPGKVNWYIWMKLTLTHKWIECARTMTIYIHILHLIVFTFFMTFWGNWHCYTLGVVLREEYEYDVFGMVSMGHTFLSPLCDYIQCRCIITSMSTSKAKTWQGLTTFRTGDIQIYRKYGNMWK